MAVGPKSNHYPTFVLTDRHGQHVLLASVSGNSHVMHTVHSIQFISIQFSFTVRNPQGNSVVERLHLTITNTFRTFLNQYEEPNADENALIDYLIASTRFAMRSAYTKALNASPGSVVFNRGMILPIPFMANALAIQQRRQQQVDQALLYQNRRRLFADYQPGDQVLVIFKEIQRKLLPCNEGPYPITQVHTNGDVTIQRTPHVFERLNIRRVKPYNA